MRDDEWTTDRAMDMKAVWFVIGLVIGGGLAFVFSLVF